MQPSFSLFAKVFYLFISVSAGNDSAYGDNYDIYQFMQFIMVTMIFTFIKNDSIDPFFNFGIISSLIYSQNPTLKRVEYLWYIQYYIPFTCDCPVRSPPIKKKPGLKIKPVFPELFRNDGFFLSLTIFPLMRAARPLHHHHKTNKRRLHSV